MQFSHPYLKVGKGGWSAVGTGSCLYAEAVVDASALPSVLLPTGATAAA